jgi:hypothetical protein
VSGQLVGLLSLHEGEVQQGFHPTSRKIQDLEKAMIKSTGVLKGGQFARLLLFLPWEGAVKWQCTFGKR